MRQGIAPRAPEADGLLRHLLGDGDPADVLERLEAASHSQAARYREVWAVVKGLDPQPFYEEEFAWVVAALRARTAG